jgi:hypothetical protein
MGLLLNSEKVRAIPILEAIARSLELPLRTMASLPVGPESTLERFCCRQIQGGNHYDREIKCNTFICLVPFPHVEAAVSDRCTLLMKTSYDGLLGVVVNVLS